MNDITLCSQFIGNSLKANVINCFQMNFLFLLSLLSV